jgi:hypothetical protein
MKTIKTIKDITEVMAMFETRTIKYEERVFKAGIEQGILTDKQHVLIDLMSIKFGIQSKTRK